MVYNGLEDKEPTIAVLLRHSVASVIVTVLFDGVLRTTVVRRGQACGGES
jgi:hypothetical protein